MSVKEGDKVRIIKSYTHFYGIGDVLEVDEIDNDGSVFVNVPSISIPMRITDEEYELITDIREDE